MCYLTTLSVAKSMYCWSTRMSGEPVIERNVHVAVVRLL